MVKKQIRREAIDEDLIRNLIGGVDAPPTLVPKPAATGLSAELPPPEPRPPATVAELVPKPLPRLKVKGAEGTEYEHLFLHPRASSSDTTCRIERGLREKLGLIVRMLGGDDMTVKAYINNIIDLHLEQYRDEINALLKNTKTIEL